MPDQSEAVKQTIEQFFRAMDDRNLELMEEVLAHDADMVHIGTDRDEIWRGWEELHAATVEQFKRLEYYRAEIRELSIHISDAVAWYEHLLDAEIKSGGRITEWTGARFTGVLEKRTGRWVIVQTHVSLPEGG